MFRLFGRAPVPRVDPEPPVPFGLKTGWFAVRVDDPADVARTLGLSRPVPVGWAAGMDRVLQRPGKTAEFLVCPPVNGWVTVVTGLHLAPDDPAGRMALLAHLGSLDRRYGAAQHFLSYRVADFVSWLRMDGGQVTRAFGWSGSEGAVLVNHGDTGPDEIAAGMPDLTGLDVEAAGAAVLARLADDLPGPDEAMPARIAGVWSVDPSRMTGPPSTCLIGMLPR